MCGGGAFRFVSCVQAIGAGDDRQLPQAHLFYLLMSVSRMEWRMKKKKEEGSKERRKIYVDSKFCVIIISRI